MFCLIVEKMNHDKCIGKIESHSVLCIDVVSLFKCFVLNWLGNFSNISCMLSKYKNKLILVVEQIN